MGDYVCVFSLLVKCWSFSFIPFVQLCPSRNDSLPVTYTSPSRKLIFIHIYLCQIGVIIKALYVRLYKRSPAYWRFSRFSCLKLGFMQILKTTGNWMSSSSVVFVWDTVSEGFKWLSSNNPIWMMTAREHTSLGINQAHWIINCLQGILKCTFIVYIMCACIPSTYECIKLMRKQKRGSVWVE